MDEAVFLRKLNAALPREKRHSLPRPASERPDADKAQAVKALQQLGSSAYAQRVISHLGTEHEGQWALFLDRALIRRTYAALNRKRAATLRAEDQLKARQSPDSDRVRRLHGFLDLLDMRIQQVEALIPGDPVNVQRHTIGKLTAAIRAHREAVQNNQMEPEPWDERLWAVLDEINLR